MAVEVVVISLCIKTKLGGFFLMKNRYTMVVV